MLFRPRSSGPGTARLLRWRIRIFGVGAVLGLAGIFLEAAWLVTTALVVLLASMAVRYTPGGDPADDPADDPFRKPVDEE